MAENLSGVPPIVTLSGLQGAPAGFSGASQQGGLSGTGGGAMKPGMTGGLDLAQLLAMLGQGGGDVTGPGTSAGLMAGLGAGGFGQSGGIGGLPSGQTQGGQSGIAGQSAAGGAGQAATGQFDPIAFLEKLFGLGSKAAGLLGGGGGSQTASPAQGGTGVSDSGQSGATGALGALGGTVGLASPLQGMQQQGIPSGQGFESAATGGSGAPFQIPQGPADFNMQITNQWDPSKVLSNDQQIIQAALESGMSPDQIQQLFQGMGGVGGYSAGEIPTGGSIPSSLSGAGGLGASNISGGLGGIQGLLGLVRGIQQGNPIGAAQGALGAYGGFTGLAGVTPLADALVSVAPETAAALTSALGGTAAAAGAGTEAASAALSGALSGAGAAAAPIIMAITSYLSNADQMNAMRSWATLGKPVTQMHEAEARALPAANQLFAGGIPNDPNTLMRDIQAGANALYTAYGTAQGPGGPIAASDYYKRTHEDPSGLAAQQQQLQNNEFNAILQAHNMGITNQQLGSLNVNPLWNGGGIVGVDPGTTSPTITQHPDFYNLRMDDPRAMAQLTGGPLMSMLAQINPALYAQIGGNFQIPQNPGGPLGEALMAQAANPILPGAQVTAEQLSDPRFAAEYEALRSPYVGSSP